MFTEWWSGHSIESTVEMMMTGEGVQKEGDPTHVIATCGDCQHDWRVRGVQQITEVIERYLNIKNK